MNKMPPKSKRSKSKSKVDESDEFNPIKYINGIQKMGLFNHINNPSVFIPMLLQSLPQPIGEGLSKMILENPDQFQGISTQDAVLKLMDSVKLMNSDLINLDSASANTQ
jgi:hypothetical protein